MKVTSSMFRRDKGRVSDLVEILGGVLRACGFGPDQAARSRVIGLDGLRKVSQPSTLRIWIWPEASSAQSSIGTVSAQGSTVWVLIRRRNSSFSRSMALVVRADFHCDGSSRVKAKQPLAGFLEAVGDRLAFEPPFAQECLAAGFDLGRGVGVDHVAVVLGQFLVHVLGSMAQKIAVLVNGAALDRQCLAPERDERGLQPRGTVDDDELGSFRPRASRSSRNWRQAAVLSPPMFLMESKTFCPSGARRWPQAPRCSWPCGPAGS